MSHSQAKTKRRTDNTTEPKALLQLCASRGKLAVELAEPKNIGPLLVTQLISSIDPLSFPVDLSGGVHRFRHRHSNLELLTIEAQFAQLTTTLTPIVRRTLNSPSLHLNLLPTDAGFTVGIHNDQQALAFSAYFAPERHIPRFVIANARSIGFGYHSHALALRVARAICSDAQTHGSIITFDNAIRTIMREILLDAGARIPTCLDTRISWTHISQAIQLTASPFTNEYSASTEVIRAIELARITESGDNALATDQLDIARSAYLTALESTPRHPDITFRIAELDLLAEHNPHSILASIVETMPALNSGIIGAQILASVNDRQAASVTLQNAAAREPFPHLAAQLLSLAASYADNTHEKLALLDDAMARSPNNTSLRWLRAHSRLAAGHFTDAIADLGRIEAAENGASNRYDTCIRGGNILLDSGLAVDARTFFEKALRYSPQSAAASRGLAQAFFSLGDHKRGIALLSRALTLSDTKAPPKQTKTPDTNHNQPTNQTDLSTHSDRIELATALAHYANDLPTAIHHVRSIPFGIRETIAARALEGRWRHQLDDTIGASHAFSLAREAASHMPASTVAEERKWLLEAADFELNVRGDPKLAKRHAELALMSSPNDPHAREMFRRAAKTEQALDQDLAPRPPTQNRQSLASTAASLEHQDTPPPNLKTIHKPANTRHDCPHKSNNSNNNSIDPDNTRIIAENRKHHNKNIDNVPISTCNDNIDDLSDATLENQIDTLTNAIRSNPSDRNTVVELCTLLARANRHMDLIALVSARLEETSDPVHKSYLTEIRNEALKHLIQQCYDANRHDEAKMYEMVLLGDTTDP